MCRAMATALNHHNQVTHQIRMQIKRQHLRKHPRRTQTSKTCFLHCMFHFTSNLSLLVVYRRPLTAAVKAVLMHRHTNRQGTLYLIQWDNTKGDSEQDFDWKTPAEILDADLIKEYYSNRYLRYLNAVDYYREPVFELSFGDIRMLFDPLKLWSNIPRNRSNSCWASSLLFCLSHLAHTGKWLAIYLALPERALSIFCSINQSINVLGLAGPSSRPACPWA